MARRLSERIEVFGRFEVETPLRVGGMAGPADVDLVVARDGLGRPYVPGTSLAGALRALLRDRVPGDHTALHGSSDCKPMKPLGAARLVVEDAVLELPKGLDVERRDGVGIDRRFGVAADRAKFDQEVVPRGSHLPMRLILDRGESADEATAARHALGTLLRLLRDEGLRLGGAQTRGLGQLRLVDGFDVQAYDLRSAPGMLDYLRVRAGERPIATHVLSLDDLGGAAPTPRLRLSVEIEWQPRGPFMVRSGQDGADNQALPLMGAAGADAVVPVLPGSSVKGALRSCAERIVRTLLPQTTMSEDWLKQLRVPLVEHLFGRPGRHSSTSGDADETQALRGALSVLDCFAQTTVSRSAWGAAQRALAPASREEAFGPDNLPSASLPAGYQQAFHVAIDRWTGGAVDGRLYSVVEPFGMVWNPIRLELDLEALSCEIREPALMLLLLTLREIAQGHLPLGYATNRGMGELRVDRIHLSGTHPEGAPEALRSLHIGQTLEGGEVGALPSQARHALTDAWERYLKEQAEVPSTAANVREE